MECAQAKYPNNQQQQQHQHQQTKQNTTTKEYEDKMLLFSALAIPSGTHISLWCCWSGWFIQSAQFETPKISLEIDILYFNITIFPWYSPYIYIVTALRSKCPIKKWWCKLFVFVLNSVRILQYYSTSSYCVWFFLVWMIECDHSMFCKLCERTHGGCPFG